MSLIISYEFTQKEQQILFSVSADDSVIFEQFADGKSHDLKYDFDNTDEHRIIKIKMSMRGKTHEHTVIGENNNILSDCAIIIKSISIDGIDVTEIFCLGNRCYTHNSNDASDEFTDEFYGYIGFNGDVCIEFSVPLHVWFLKYCQ